MENGSAGANRDEPAQRLNFRVEVSSGCVLNLISFTIMKRRSWQEALPRTSFQARVWISSIYFIATPREQICKCVSCNPIDQSIKLVIIQQIYLKDLLFTRTRNKWA